MKTYRYLSDSERSEIEILHRKGYSMRKIAVVLGRSPNTISYELKRCSHGYKAALGKQYARTTLKNRRFQWRKLNHHKELRVYVVQGLEKGWNPHEISGRLKYEKKDMDISATTIYTWLLTDVRAEQYKKYLYMYRCKRKRHRKRGHHGQIRYMTPIQQREKVSVGTWETDLVVSKRSGSGALSTSNELISRYLVVDYVPDTKASSKQKTLHRLEREYFVRSITFDRGHENSRHYECSSKTYFCDPYSSYQRGANENQNKLLRRYFPKGTDFSNVSSRKLATVVALINNKPRKSLGYRTATEVAKEIGLFTGVS
jgi:IS30 family transposase